MSTDAPRTQSDFSNGPSTASSEAGYAQAKQVATEKLQSYGNHFVSEPTQDIGRRLLDYARQKPDIAAMWCFGAGVIVGWKLRG